MNDIRVYRVYRSCNFHYYEVGYNEVYVVSVNENQAKGIAIAKHPSLKEDIAKKDILVEEIKLEVGTILGAN